jgi:hypothetical protein
VTGKDAERARGPAEEAAAEDQPPPVPTCRFLFPRPPQEAAEVIKRPGKGWWSFEADRNDTHLNQYNPLVAVCWLANIDCSPCTSVEAVINYAAEYCSKPESQTATDAQIAKSILPRISDPNPMVSFVSKLMNKLQGEGLLRPGDLPYLAGTPSPGGQPSGAERRLPAPRPADSPD